MKEIKAIRRYLIITTLFAALICSCTREEDDLSSQNCPGNCTIIKGRFTTANRTEGLANIPLEAVWDNTKRNGIGKSGVRRLKAAGRTDANGYYELKFLMRDDELADSYFFVRYKSDPEKYIFPEASNFFLELKRDTTVTYDYLIPRKAFVELKVVNQDAIKPNDSFYTQFTFDFGTVEPGRGSQTYGAHNNNKYYSNSTLEVAGDQPVIVRLSKLKDSTRTVQFDTLLIPRGQKYTFTTQF